MNREMAYYHLNKIDVDIEAVEKKIVFDNQYKDIIGHDYFKLSHERLEKRLNMLKEIKDSYTKFLGVTS